MDTTTFAQKIKAKYPAYQSVDDATLVNKFLEKYPVYKSQVNVQPETGIYKSSTPIQPVQPTIEQQKEQAISQGKPVSVRSDRVEPTFLGSILRETLKAPIKTALSVPAGVMGEKGITIKSDYLGDTSDISKIIRDNSEQLAERVKAGEITLPGALLRSTGQSGLEALDVAGLIPTGAGAKAGTKLAQEGAEQVAKGATKAAGTVGDILKPVTETILDTVQPEKIMQRVARIPKGEQVKFQKLTGESVGEYLVKRNIFGNEDEILQKLYKRFNDSKSEVDTALAKLQGTFKPKQLSEALSALIKREASVSSPGALSPDAKRVTQLAGKYKTGGLTMSEINEVKRLYEKNVRVDYLKSAANNPEKVVKATNLDSAIRKWQMEQAEKLGLKNLPDINKETQAARSLLESFGKEVVGTAGNNALSLTDAILISGGDPASIGMLVGKKILSGKGLQSKIAKTLSKNKPKKEAVKAVFGKGKKDLTDFLTK